MLMLNFHQMTIDFKKLFKLTIFLILTSTFKIATIFLILISFLKLQQFFNSIPKHCSKSQPVDLINK